MGTSVSEQLLAERTVHDGVRLLRTVEEERQIEEAELLDLADEQAGVQDRHIEGTALDRRDGLQVAAQLAAWEQTDLDLAAALLLDQFRELLGALPLRMLLRVLERKSDGALFDLGVCRSWQEKHAAQQRTADDLTEMLHDSDLPNVFSGWFVGARHRGCELSPAILRSIWRAT